MYVGQSRTIAKLRIIKLALDLENGYHLCGTK